MCVCKIWYVAYLYVGTGTYALYTQILLNILINIHIFASVTQPSNKISSLGSLGTPCSIWGGYRQYKSPNSYVGIGRHDP